MFQKMYSKTKQIFNHKNSRGVRSSRQLLQNKKISSILTIKIKIELIFFLRKNYRLSLINLLLTKHQLQ
ncbi:hypothetical protein FQT09_08085 [Enterococcus hirae]|nr:hypothetical protein [Enterococcus hirae]